MTGLVNATGSLLSFRGGASEFLTSLQRVGVQSRALTVGKWSELAFTTTEPLMPENVITDSYSYTFLARESEEDDARLILVGPHGDMVERLLERASMQNDARRPRVDVAGLVRRLVAEPDRYRLSAVFARADGFGQALRSVAFYGSDVAGASLFTDALAAVEAYRVQLREQRTGIEVLSVGSRGELSFIFSGNNRALSKVDKALGFLKRWISW